MTKGTVHSSQPFSRSRQRQTGNQSERNGENNEKKKTKTTYYLVGTMTTGHLDVSQLSMNSCKQQWARWEPVK